MEAKFRAWDKKEKRMLQGDMLQVDFGGRNFGVYWLEESELCLGDSEDFDLMQFTGLHDKNGREIYEDDIVRYGHNIDTIGPNLGVCFDGGFKEGVAAISITPCGILVGEENIIFMAEHFCDGIDGNIEELEIIGNIHENPDLLEVKS